MRGSAGTSVVEALVALLLGLFLLQAGMLVVGRGRSQHQRVVERAEGLAAVRLTGTLLRLETSIGIGGADWALSGDELSLRAFRGTGLVCGGLTGPDVVVVAFSGYRRPDPDKDSVQLVYPQGAREVVALRGADPVSDASCGGAPMTDATELRLAATVAPGAVVARIFERGAYVLSGRALRYRRGAGGRQPLTPELWDTPTGWRLSGRRLEADLLHSDGGQPMLTARGSGDLVRWVVPVGVVP